MGEYRPEQRNFKRVFFTEQHNIKAVFSCPGNDGNHTISATVLNLSETGMGLALHKVESNGIRSGDQLILKKIIGLPELCSVQNLNSQVRWILNQDFLDHLGFGCEFLHIPPAAQKIIRQFVTIEKVISEYAP